LKPRRVAVPGLSHPSGPAFPGVQFQRLNGIVYDPSPGQEIARALKSGLAAPDRTPGNGAGGVTVESFRRQPSEWFPRAFEVRLEER